MNQCEDMLQHLDGINRILNKANEAHQPGVFRSLYNFTKSFFVTPVEIPEALEKLNTALRRFKPILDIQKETLANLEAEENDDDLYQYTGASTIDYTANGNWRTELQINNLNALEEMDIVEPTNFKTKYNAAFPDDPIPVNLDKVKRIEKLKRYIAKFCPDKYRFNPARP